jgi:hypothetical protein
MASNAAKGANPPRIGRLDSMQRTRREITRLYKDLRHGKVSPTVANACCFLLNSNIRAIADEDFEARLERLEKPEKLINGRALTFDGVFSSTTEKT